MLVSFLGKPSHVLWGVALPSDGMTPFELGRDDSGLLRRWMRMA
jgi:hypothetical protein